jgi:predicted metal-binding membrane protein
MAMVFASKRRGFAVDALLVWGVVLTAWALTLVLHAGGGTAHWSHDALLAGRALPSQRALLLFLAAWQVMTAAMMLPSSLPLIRLFTRASQGQDRPGLALGVFLAAYFAVWSGFALLALGGDAGLHALVARWRWLDERPQFIAGGVLLAAGAFQFSPVKERCLDACRTPMNFLWRYYGRGVKPAWILGIRHGLFCLGCCWALMLAMFAVGVGSLAWMAALTGVMTIEKSTRWGRRLVPWVGATLLLWGGLVLAHPDWLPAPLLAN